MWLIISALMCTTSMHKQFGRLLEFSVATHWYFSGVLEAQFSWNGAGTVVSDAKYTTTRVRSMLFAVKMPRHFLFVFFCSAA